MRGRERRDRLARFAKQIGARTLPYYLHGPRSPSEAAPGWYWIPTGRRHPEYLGYSSVDAEITLRQKIETMTPA